MNPIVSRAHDALWRAVTEEVALSHDAAILWSVMLTAAICDRRQGMAQRVIASAGWHYTTTQSRLIRAGLPTINACVDRIGLAYAAALFDGEDDRVASVAYTLGHPTHSTLNRHMRRTLGMTAVTFRETIGFPTAREQMLDLVVRPYREQWATWTHLSQRTYRLSRLGPPRSLVAA